MEAFECLCPHKRAGEIMQAVRCYNDPMVLADMSSGLEGAMTGLDIREGDDNWVGQFVAGVSY